MKHQQKTKEQNREAVAGRSITTAYIVEKATELLEFCMGNKGRYGQRAINCLKVLADYTGGYDRNTVRFSGELDVEAKRKQIEEAEEVHEQLSRLTTPELEQMLYLKRKAMGEFEGEEDKVETAG